MFYGNDALDELGILDGINEVIATTERSGRINAAPLGMIRLERAFMCGFSWELIPMKTS